VALPAPDDEALDPVRVSLLGAAAVMQPPDRVVHLIEQTRRTRRQSLNSFTNSRLTHRNRPIKTCIFVQYYYLRVSASVSGEV
jgi:hypothetical protein